MLLLLNVQLVKLFLYVLKLLRELNVRLEHLDGFIELFANMKLELVGGNIQWHGFVRSIQMIIYELTQP